MSRPTAHRLALVSAVDPVLLDLTALSLSGQEALVLTATLHSSWRPDQDDPTGPGAWDASARGRRANPPQATGPGAWDASGQEADWPGADQEGSGWEEAGWEEAGPRDGGGWDVPGWEEGPGYGVVRLTGGAWHEPVHLDLPMRHACAALQVQPENCIYVGDAERDIQAGLNAGMQTILAAWGYIAPGDTPETWGYHASAANPLQILDILRTFQAA